jgi:hypothetical protein
MDGLIRSAPEPADLINVAGQCKGALIETGATAFRKYLLNAQEAGVNHIAINLKVSNRPYREILQELATEVLPFFKSRSSR